MEIYLVYILASLALTGTLAMSARREQDYTFWKAVVIGALVLVISVGLAEVTEKVFFGVESIVVRQIVAYLSFLLRVVAVAGITHFFFRIGIKNGIFLGVAYVLVLLFIDWLRVQV